MLRKSTFISFFVREREREREREKESAYVNSEIRFLRFLFL